MGSRGNIGTLQVAWRDWAAWQGQTLCESRSVVLTDRFSGQFFDTIYVRFFLKQSKLVALPKENIKYMKISYFSRA